MDFEKDSVLIIDDDIETITTLSDVFVSSGINAIVSSDPFEIENLLREKEPDLVIIDPTFAYDRGWLTLIDIRHEAEYLPIPIIALCKKDQALVRTLAFEQGVQQYVQKPVDGIEIVARAKGLLSRRRLLAAQSPIEPKVAKMPVHKGSRTVLLDPRDILYFSAKNKSTYAHTLNGRYLTDKTLIEFEEQFAPDEFIRTHRSYLVRSEAASELTRNEEGLVLILKDGAAIPVARRQARTVKAALGFPTKESRSE